MGRNRNQMARDLGTSWQHVDRWERGATEPSPESLRKLAGYLEVTVDHLLGTEAPETAAENGGGGDAFDDFHASYAPRDITDAELAWLRAAPVDHAQATPGDYVNMLHGLRSTARPASTPPPARAARPKSGRNRKVDASGIIETNADTGEGESEVG
jgi:transcriptional regulator with XRE-family HTH domain